MYGISITIRYTWINIKNYTASFNYIFINNFKYDSYKKEILISNKLIQKCYPLPIFITYFFRTKRDYDHIVINLFFLYNLSK